MAVLPSIDERRTRFLSAPRRRPLDPVVPEDPWEERYGWDGGRAACSCCGRRVRRVAVVTSTGGVEFDLGLACYARAYPEAPPPPGELRSAR